MGLLTGLSTITTTLIVLTALAGLVVVAASVFVVIPTLLESRTERRARHITIPTWYLHPAAIR